MKYCYFVCLFLTIFSQYAVAQQDPSSSDRLGDVIWKTDFPDEARILTTPTAGNDRIYVGGHLGKIYCLTQKTGDILWSFESPVKYTSFSESGLVIEDSVFFGSSQGRFFCLNTKTGEKKWSLKTRKRIESSAAFDGEHIYITAGNEILSIDPEAQQVNWKFDTNDDIRSTPAVSGGKLVVGSSDKHFYCLNTSNGQLSWKKNINSNEYAVSIWKGNVLLIDKNHRLSLVRLSSGNAVWERATKYTFYGNPIIFKDEIYVFGGRVIKKKDKKVPKLYIFKIKAKTGKIIGKEPVDKMLLPIGNRELVVGNKTIFYYVHGKYGVLDREKMQMIGTKQYGMEAELAKISPVISKNKLILSTENVIYALDLKSITVSDHWPTFRGNPARTGSND